MMLCYTWRTAAACPFPATQTHPTHPQTHLEAGLVACLGGCLDVAHQLLLLPPQRHELTVQVWGRRGGGGAQKRGLSGVGACCCLLQVQHSQG
jgi:hypothetical protein